MRSTVRTRNQRAEADARALTKITVDREEYDALCTLRDGEHAALSAKLTQLAARQQDLLAINSEQRERLVRAVLELDHLRQAAERHSAREGVLEARIGALIKERDDALGEAARLRAPKPLQAFESQHR